MYRFVTVSFLNNEETSKQVKQFKKFIRITFFKKLMLVFKLTVKLKIVVRNTTSAARHILT